MRSRNASRILLTSLLALAMAVPFLTMTRSVKALTGTIYTTDVACAGVDINIYTSKDDVYLNGGPQGGGSGLPDGSYYVKVTEPNGTLLGTSVGSGNPTPVTVTGGSFVQCYLLSAVVIKASDSTPGYDDTSNPGGEYKVWVSTGSSFDNNQSKTDNFKVKTSGGGGTEITLSGTKFYDLNVDGIKDPTEVGIPGFIIIVIVNGTPFATTTTDANGGWTVSGVPVGATIRVCEVLPPANPDGSFWLQTAPDVNVQFNDRCYFGTTTDADITDLDFGNVCLRNASGGFTLGFWSNKNGQALITGSDLCALNGLCLTNATGGIFDPVAGCPAPTASQITSAKTALKNWLLSANAINMAYMLSAQLTATKLDTLHGLNPNTIVLLTPAEAACFGSNTAVISTVMSQANSSLCANPNTTAGSPQRSYQECLKNILDDINNNRLPFVSPGPCDVSYPQ